jgi:hypothetical protein
LAPRPKALGSEPIIAWVKRSPSSLKTLTRFHVRASVTRCISSQAYNMEQRQTHMAKPLAAVSTINQSFQQQQNSQLSH